MIQNCIYIYIQVQIYTRACGHKWFADQLRHGHSAMLAETLCGMDLAKAVGAGGCVYARCQVVPFILFLKLEFGKSPDMIMGQMLKTKRHDSDHRDRYTQLMQHGNHSRSGVLFERHPFSLQARRSKGPCGKNHNP